MVQRACNQRLDFATTSRARWPRHGDKLRKLKIRLAGASRSLSVKLHAAPRCPRVLPRNRGYWREMGRNKEIREEIPNSGAMKEWHQLRIKWIATDDNMIGHEKRILKNFTRRCYKLCNAPPSSWHRPQSRIVTVTESRFARFSIDTAIRMSCKSRERRISAMFHILSWYNQVSNQSPVSVKSTRSSAKNDILIYPLIPETSSLSNLLNLARQISSIVLRFQFWPSWRFSVRREIPVVKWIFKDAPSFLRFLLYSK